VYQQLWVVLQSQPWVWESQPWVRESQPWVLGRPSFHPLTRCYQGKTISDHPCRVYFGWRGTFRFGSLGLLGSRCSRFIGEKGGTHGHYGALVGKEFLDHYVAQGVGARRERLATRRQELRANLQLLWRGSRPQPCPFR